MLDLRPIGPGIIEGIVTTPIGVPIPSAAVTVELRSRDLDLPALPIPAWRTITNARGEFGIRALPVNSLVEPPVCYQITAHAGNERGYRLTFLFEECLLDVAHVVVPSSYPVDELELVNSLKSEFWEPSTSFSAVSVSGRVLDAESGEPVEGVIIRSFQSGPGNDRAIYASSDVDGQYCFESLPPGHRVFLRMHKAGYRIGESREAKHIRLDPGMRVENVDFRISRGLDVSGRVVDEEGNPIPGVEIQGKSQSDDDQSQSTLSDVSGAFVLRGFAPGSVIEVCLRESAWWANGVERLDIGDTSVSGLEIVVAPGASLIGIVVDDLGMPMPDVYLSLKYCDGHGDALYADSGEFGEFYFRGLRSGRYELNASRACLDFYVEGGEQVSGIRLVLPKRESLTGYASRKMSISGRVVNRLGEPVAGARVYAFNRPPEGLSESHCQTESDEDGYFHACGLAGGVHQITTCGDGYAVNILKEVVAGAVDVEIVLERLIVVAGCVVDDGTSDPLRDFRVARTGRHPGNLEDSRLEFASCHDPYGRYEVWSYPGEVTVIVQAEGYVTGSIHIAAVEEGAELEGQEIRLKRLG